MQLQEEEQAEQKKREAMRNEWQQAKVESSDEGEGEGGETDEELGRDEDLRK